MEHIQKFVLLSRVGSLMELTHIVLKVKGRMIVWDVFTPL